MWRPSGNRGGNRGRGSPGRGGSQSASPWPDSNNGRQGRRGYGENQNNQFQQKSKSDDPRNHVGMSFRGSGRPVTRPEAPGPNANSSSGGLGNFFSWIFIYTRIGFRDESTREFQRSTSQKYNSQIDWITIIFNTIHIKKFQTFLRSFQIFIFLREIHILQELLKCYFTAQYEKFWEQLRYKNRLE